MVFHVKVKIGEPRKITGYNCETETEYYRYQQYYLFDTYSSDRSSACCKALIRKEDPSSQWSKIITVLPRKNRLSLEVEKSMSNKQKILSYMSTLVVDFKEALSLCLFEAGENEYKVEINIQKKYDESLYHLLQPIISDIKVIGVSFYVEKEGNVVVAIGSHKAGDEVTLHISGAENEVKNLEKLIKNSDLVKKPAKIKRITVGENKHLMANPYPLQPVKDFDSKDFYPQFEQTPEEIAEEFKQSSANVLLLIGEPGTGKSNFLRRIMDYYGYESQPYIVDNEDILLNPHMITYLQQKEDMELFIAEDADNFVTKRSEHNRSMVGLLNMTSGVAQSKGKVILSTNLPNISKVDPALLRSGRCYKIIEFQKLTQDEAQNVRNKYGDGSIVDKPMTLAEAINGENGKNVVKASLGFGFNLS